MVKNVLFGSIFLISILISVGLTAKAITQNIPVQVEIPATTLTVNGKTSPNSQVIVKDSDTIISTTTSDNFGNFSVTTNTTLGIHNFKVYSVNTKGKKTVESSKFISIQAQKNTEYVVFLSPTVERGSSTPLQKGSVMIIRGYSYPNSNLVLNLDYGAQFQSTTSDNSGYYEFSIDTSNLSLTDHTVTVSANYSGESSDNSQAVGFKVINTTDISKPDIIVNPDLLPPPVVEIPEDGAVIDGNKVLISGEATPNSQINIYQDGEIYGSIFTDEFGKWQFEFTATYSPVTLTFESCISGRCSTLSKTLTLYFPNLEKCDIWFELGKYRFWDIKVNEEVVIDILLSSGDGVLSIDWGNGDYEEFNHDSDRPKPIIKKYTLAGQYNGKIVFNNSNCNFNRYFSVNVVEGEQDFQYENLMWITVLIISMYIVKQIYTHDRQNTR